ncbi:MAG: thioredoxin domain-containing protein [Thermomicrobiales bacterium]
MPNRLANETSPYLLQHKDNPVDWYPWGDEALETARRENKPILVSIGYSACHWCHVMEHETFEDPDVAALMNRLFVNIKVDREERPDIDHLYMTAVQAMAGGGGWPLNCFLTPDGAPFYGGTYFPAEEQHGIPSWRKVLGAVNDAFTNRRDDVDSSAEKIAEFLRTANSKLPDPGVLRTAILDSALEGFAESLDDENGGFGGAPKFPQPSALVALLHIWKRTGSDDARSMLKLTLDRMAAGGIYDQVGGGFHRYAVDDVWLVPHFEKMLYDNAQLASVYLDAWRAFGDESYQRIVTEILEWVVREMTGPEGQFYAAQDADTEGEEGRFYVWTPAELTAALGPERAALAAEYFGVTETGNFEGRNVLSIPVAPAKVAVARSMMPAALKEQIDDIISDLFTARSERIWPGTDEKAIASWNGMMLKAMAAGGRALDRADLLAAAAANAEFLLGTMRQRGRLFRSWKDGQAKTPGFLEDFANVIDGLLALHAATLEPRWLDEAISLADVMLASFADPSGPGFYDTAMMAEQLVARPREIQDGATPSGNSVAADVLLRIGAMTGETAMTTRAVGLLETLADPMAQGPVGFGRAIAALDFHLSAPMEVALAGEPGTPDMDALLAVIAAGYRPNLLVGAANEHLGQRAPFLADKPARNGRATAYVCERFACMAPVTDADALRQQLDWGSGMDWLEI